MSSPSRIARNVPFLISEQATAGDRAIFDGEEGRWITYGELRRLVSEAGHHLETPCKSLLLLFAGGTLADIVWYVAAIDAGHAVMLADPLLREQQTRPLIERYAPDWVVGGPELGRGIGGYQATAVRQGSSLLLRRHPCPDAPLHADQALLLSTSGTTGSRKHACLSRGNVEANAEAIALALRIEASDRAISTLPLHYSYGLSVVNSHLHAGAAVVLNRFSVIEPQFWSLVHETAATSMAGVPFVYQMLSRVNPARIADSSIRVMTQAGGRLATDLVGRFHTLMASAGGRFFVMYGQTEATARIAVLDHVEMPRKPESVGRAIPGGALAIRTHGDPDAGDGEIVYTGPNVMLGYAESRDDLSLGDRLHGVLPTADTGRLDRDGFLYVTGRSRRIAKVAGKRVSLDDIDRLVPDDCPHAVVGRDDEIHIFCVGGTRDWFGELSRRLSAATGLHRAVFRFRDIDTIPVTSNGKTDYQHLTALL